MRRAGTISAAAGVQQPARPARGALTFVLVPESRTTVVQRDGKTILVLTTARNLDAAMDAAEQWHGRPFTWQGTWTEFRMASHPDVWIRFTEWTGGPPDPDTWACSVHDKES